MILKIFLAKADKKIFLLQKWFNYKLIYVIIIKNILLGNKFMKKFITLALAAILSLCCFACTEPDENSNDIYYAKYNTNANADIEVDFSEKDGEKVQNLHKFDMFTPTHYHVDKGQLWEESFEQFQHLAPLKAESYRVDARVDSTGGVGYSPELNAGNWDDPDVTLNRMYTFSDALLQNNTMPYFILLGNPVYTRAEGGNSFSTPNMEKYTEYLERLSKEFKNSGRRVTFETWNEPDLNTTYFKSGMVNFVDMSVQGAKALKQGNEDATVVEMGLCYPNKFCNDFIPAINGTLFDYYMQKNVEFNNVVDYFSWHYYGGVNSDMEGNTDDLANFSYFSGIVRDKINQASSSYDLHTMSQHVTEFAPSAQKSSDLVQSGLIGKVYDAMDDALKATDISRVSWVSYYTNWGYAIVNLEGNVKRPIYYALWSYARLPQAQAKVVFNKTMKDTSVIDGEFDTFSVRTGVDSKRASAIVCNNVLNPKYIGPNAVEYKQRLEDSRKVNVKLKNIPFNAKTLSIYLIDGVQIKDSHNVSEPYKVLDVKDLQLNNNQTTLSLKIPGNSAFYIEINDESGLGERDVVSNLESHILKKTYYYEDRASMMPYADIYEDGYSVALGMLNNQTGKTAICVTMDKMNEFTGVQMKWDVFAKQTITGTTGVRVDFHTSEGYAYSKTYYIGVGNGFTYKGFGTGEDANALAKMASNGKFDYTINLVNDAPSGWDGKIQMTYFMQDAGVNTAASVVCKGV